MDKLLFGTAGIPISTMPRNTTEGVKRVRALGLDAMELEFVQSVNISEEKAPLIRQAAKENNIVLTCHGQYFINLNSVEKEKRDASIERVLKAAKITSMCGGWSVCFHAAYYLGNPDLAYRNVRDGLKEVTKKLKDSGVEIWIRPETGGKISQFGSLEELIKISQEVESVLPCIDFAHHYARSLGKINTYEDFSFILESLEKGLGKEALDNMHCHTEGIEFGNTGERSHLNLDESKLNYQDLIRAWKDFRIKGVIICESPNIEKDALMIKNIYGKN